MNDLKLFKFRWGCGRMGDLEGLFAATQAEVDALVGSRLCFGEVLGKHSDICGTFEAGEVVALNVQTDVVEQIVAACGGTISGFNPLEYVEEEDD